MADYTLGQVFGPTATQNATDLVIKKADLAGVGLVASANNTGESLLVALALYWLTNLSETNRLLDETNRNCALSDAGTDIYEGSTATFMRRSFAISIYKAYVVPSLNPNDY
ncbi:MAG TPA: hypothetical protein V6D07_09735 [Trichocoleus sp.]